MSLKQPCTVERLLDVSNIPCRLDLGEATTWGVFGLF
jgi:hypothetical protein